MPVCVLLGTSTFFGEVFPLEDLPFEIWMRSVDARVNYSNSDALACGPFPNLVRIEGRQGPLAVADVVCGSHGSGSEEQGSRQRSGAHQVQHSSEAQLLLLFVLSTMALAK
ncbi:hypothetical protein H180DRAFT_02668 [Streptomyces sp. WMMB 322]|nr:hypothetical protein H180DRAFT_02668 [Streptomyces sp. WMMB 322]